MMEFDIEKASRRLSELDIKIQSEDLSIDILWFRVMHAPEGDIINLHTHSSYEFHFIPSGIFKVKTENGEFEAKAGEFYLTAPYVYHEQQAVGKGISTEYCMNCDIAVNGDSRTESEKIINVLNSAPCTIFPDHCGSMALFETALKEAFYQQLGYYNNIRNIALMIIFMAARSMNPSSDIKYDVPVKPKENLYRFELIKKYIEDNMSHSISTKDIASYLYLSDKQVLRIVRDITGMTTKDFILSLKLQKAKQLLKETRLSIRQISDSLGFTSEYYFNQFFKRKDGYPPGVFRSNIQNV